MRLSLELDHGLCDALDAVAAHTGMPREMAAQYAVRLVAACIREGLLEEEPSRAWPQEAHAAPGRVIAFPARRARRRRSADGRKAQKE